MIKTKLILYKFFFSVFIFVLFFSLPSFMIAKSNTIDLSESILKLGNFKVHNLDSKGFAAYDEGEKTLKFFNWSFEQIAKFPIKFGEGPSEIRQAISSVLVDNDKVFVNGIFERKIYVYDKRGTLQKSIPIKSIPYKVALRNKMIYTVNYSMTGKAESIVGLVLNPDTGQETKTVKLERDLFQLKDVPEDSLNLYGQWNAYDVDDYGNIYLLIGAVHTLFVLDDSGVLHKKILLPYKHNMEIKDVQNGKKVFRQLSVYGWYKDMAVIDGNIYICYVNQVGKDKSGRLFYDTHILRYLPSGKYEEKKVKGFCLIMGFNMGKLFVFNIDDYHAIPCNFSKNP